MKFGLFALNYGPCADPDTTIDVARYAESAGLESVWTGEHIVLPDPRPANHPLLPPDQIKRNIDWIAAHLLDR
jgi:alkanesulfonate monooxygenase SsuD/methylene tetrahydromethanopterin reductase-like flavin-dependent oxidoreductase (luciferase family)